VCVRACVRGWGHALEPEHCWRQELIAFEDGPVEQSNVANANVIQRSHITERPPFDCAMMAAAEDAGRNSCPVRGAAACTRRVHAAESMHVHITERPLPTGVGAWLTCAHSVCAYGAARVRVRVRVRTCVVLRRAACALFLRPL
jgi:hypothetical protein